MIRFAATRFAIWWNTRATLKGPSLALAAWLVAGANICGIIWLGWLYSRHSIVIQVEKTSDIATLTLTSATVVLAGVAIAVGVAAVWGFKEIRETAIKAAVDAALKAVAPETRRAFDQGQASPGADEANQIAQDMDRAENGG